MVGMPARVVLAPQCSIRVAPALPPPWLRENPNALPHKSRTSVLLPRCLRLGSVKTPMLCRTNPGPPCYLRSFCSEKTRGHNSSGVFLCRWSNLERNVSGFTAGPGAPWGSKLLGSR
jgi:hypothetical protein